MKSRKLPFCILVSPKQPCKMSNSPAGERSHAEDHETPHVCMKRTAWMLQPTLLGFFGYLLPLPNPETSFPRATIWRSGFGLMEE